MFYRVLYTTLHIPLIQLNNEIYKTKHKNEVFCKEFS